MHACLPTVDADIHYLATHPISSMMPGWLNHFKETRHRFLDIASSLRDMQGPLANGMRLRLLPRLQQQSSGLDALFDAFARYAQRIKEWRARKSQRLIDECNAVLEAVVMVVMQAQMPPQCVGTGPAAA